MYKNYLLILDNAKAHNNNFVKQSIQLHVKVYERFDWIYKKYYYFEWIWLNFS